MSADVEKAVEILGQFVHGEHNSLGNTWGKEMAASKLVEVAQALRDKDAEIARLAQESFQNFTRGREWAELSGRMASLLASGDTEAWRWCDAMACLLSGSASARSCLNRRMASEADDRDK